MNIPSRRNSEHKFVHVVIFKDNGDMYTFRDISQVAVIVPGLISNFSRAAVAETAPPNKPAPKNRGKGR